MPQYAKPVFDAPNKLGLLKEKRLFVILVFFYVTQAPQPGGPGFDSPCGVSPASALSVSTSSRALRKAHIWSTSGKYRPFPKYSN